MRKEFGAAHARTPLAIICGVLLATALQAPVLADPASEAMILPRVPHIEANWPDPGDGWVLVEEWVVRPETPVADAPGTRTYRTAVFALDAPVAHEREESPYPLVASHYREPSLGR